MNRSILMKRTGGCRGMQAAQKRILSGVVAAAVLALTFMVPLRAASAETEVKSSALILVFVHSDEMDLTGDSGAEAIAPQSDGETEAEAEDSQAAEPATQQGDSAAEDTAEATADETEATDAAEPTDTAAESTADEVQSEGAVESQTADASEAEQAAESATEAEAASDSGALVISNEYIFYTDDADYAAGICLKYGGSLLRWSDGIGVMYSVSAPNDDGDVVFYPQEIYLVESSPYYEQQGESYAQIGAAQASASNAGAGVVIAVIDSGIDLDHPALADSILDAVSVIPSSAYGSGGYFLASYEGAQDYEGHGSHIAGILVGQTEDLTIGIVPAAQILSIKALEKYGTSAAGTTEWLIRAIQYAISQNVDIINLSIGGSSSYVSAAQVMLKKAADAGILVVCATGNTGADPSTTDTIDYPAAYDSTLAVSCVTVDGDSVSLSGFSKYGEGTDLSAPGVAIYSCNAKGAYTVLSGTSMSCAVVSGIAALLLSQKSSLTPQQLITLLEKTAYDAGDVGYDTMFGWGVVDAKAALLLLRHQSGQTKPTLPGLDTEEDLTQTAPLGQETDAASDWLTTQTQTDTSQSEQPTSGQNTQNSGDHAPEIPVLTWALLSIGGGLSLCGAGLLIRFRFLRKAR